MAENDLSPQQRIDIAEAETIEALRDLLIAEARSAVAEATMMENFVEVHKATGNALMSLYGQGPLPTESAPAWLKTLWDLGGKSLAEKAIEKGLDFVKDLFGSSNRQQGRAEQIKQAANKEAVATGRLNIINSPGTTVSSSGAGTSSSGAGSPGGGSPLINPGIGTP